MGNVSSGTKLVLLATERFRSVASREDTSGAMSRLGLAVGVVTATYFDIGSYSNDTLWDASLSFNIDLG